VTCYPTLLLFPPPRRFPRLGDHTKSLIHDLVDDFDNEGFDNLFHELAGQTPPGVGDYFILVLREFDAESQRFRRFRPSGAAFLTRPRRPAVVIFLGKMKRHRSEWVTYDQQVGGPGFGFDRHFQRWTQFRGTAALPGGLKRMLNDYSAGLGQPIDEWVTVLHAPPSCGRLDFFEVPSIATEL
jgi:hypothetical protein